MTHRIACFVLLLGLFSSSAPAQMKLLHDKFVSRLHTIADTADCVVGVAIKDLTTNDEYLINGDEVFPQASAIKIHILSELYRQAERGRFRLTDLRPSLTATRVGGSGILVDLGDSVKMSIRDYAVLMMVLSDNSATNLLIDLVGMENVNASVKKEGATHTALQRIMMDYKAAAEGRENISTPRDVALILEKMYRGTLVSPKASADMIALMEIDKGSAGPVQAGVPSGVVVANKEGDIEGVRCDVAIVYLTGRPYIIAVMTKLLLRDADGPPLITAISRLTYEYFERLANSNQFGRRIPR